LAERLFEVRVFPLAAPGLLPAGVPISAAALDSTTLLEIAQSPDLWPQYLAGIGLAGYQPRRSQTFDNAQVMFAAVANGLGLALGARELVERQLASGRLVAPFSNPPVAIRQSYHLVYTKDRRDQPALKALRRALLGEAQPRVR
jgi:LysR family glycine cleavage system transcriptional activator